MISFPIVAVYFQSEYARHVMGNVVITWLSKIKNIKYAFKGDSITAGRRNWGALSVNANFNTINLAGSGYTTQQIIAQAIKAQDFHPSYCCVLAGTNDVVLIADSVFLMSAFIRSYNKLITTIERMNIDPIITLIPDQSKETYAGLISFMN